MTQRRILHGKKPAPFTAGNVFRIGYSTLPRGELRVLGLGIFRVGDLADREQAVLLQLAQACL